jgi:hypothetical protein
MTRTGGVTNATMMGSVLATTVVHGNTFGRNWAAIVETSQKPKGSPTPGKNFRKLLTGGAIGEPLCRMVG